MMFVACSNDGDSTIPEIPDDPDGSKVTMLSRGGSRIFLDDTDNGIALDSDGRLQGENVFYKGKAKPEELALYNEAELAEMNEVGDKKRALFQELYDCVDRICL